MTMSRGRKTDPTVQRLSEVAEKLPEDHRRTLLHFAEFLLAQAPEPEPEALPEPRPIPRPPEESVIKAMRRLSETYFMVERGRLLNETSALMAQHVLQGRSASEVIDELEIVFASQYERLRSE